MRTGVRQAFLGLALWLITASLAQGVNLLPGDSSFETGHGAWTGGEIVSDQASDGARSLKFSKDVITHAVMTLAPDTDYVMSAYLRSEVDGVQVMLEGYRTNWTGDNARAYVRLTTSWQRYELPFPRQKLGGHNKFWLAVRPQGNAVVWMDAVQFEMNAAATPWQAAEPVALSCAVLSPVAGNIFFPEEVVALSVQVYNSRTETTTVRLRLTARDYEGRTVHEWAHEATLAAKKSLAEKTTVTAPLTRKGPYFYTCELAVGQDSAPAVCAEGSFAIVDRPLPVAPRTSLFGMAASPQERLPALARIGVKKAALAIRWAYTDEKTKGLTPRQAEASSRAVEACLENGIEPMVYLRRTPRWATLKQHPHDIFPPREEMAPAYGEFARQTAELFKGKVRYYQLWGGEADLLAGHVQNELGKDMEWFTGMVAALHKYGYQGIKQADPEAVVAVTGVSGVDCTHSRYDFLRQLLPKLDGQFDEVTIHPYCYPWTFAGGRYVQTPEEADLTRKYRTISELAGGKPVGNGEFGFAIEFDEPLDGVASRRQADYLVRSFLMTASVPAARQLMWYTVVGNYDAFSIWKWPNPRPCVAAYAAAAQRLEGTADPQEVTLGSLVRGVVWRKGSGATAALWAPDNREAPYAPPAELAGTGQILDLMGNPLAVDEQGAIKLSSSPVFFEMPTLAAPDLAAALQAGKLLVQPVSCQLRVANQQTVKLFLTNQLPGELSGKVTVAAPLSGGRQDCEVALAPLRSGVMEVVTVTLPAPLNLEALDRGVPISGVVRTAAGDVKFQETVELLSCPRVTSAITVDGALREWSNRPAIVLDTTKNLFPPDAASHSLWKNAADLSIRAWIGWDETYFYFAARVLDDVHVNVQTSGKTIWAGDCVQLGFDTLNDALTAGYAPDDREINIGYSSAVGRCLIGQTWPPPARLPEGCMAAAVPGPGYVDYELAVPLAVLVPLRLEAGEVFGFNFVAVDMDVNRTDCWMGLTYGICGGKDPSVFKRFLLTSPGAAEQ